MYGHQDDAFYGISWQWEHDRSDTYELVGDYPAVCGFDLGGLEEHHDKDLDSVPFAWIREEAIRHIQRGGIVTFSWHPRNPVTGGTAWDVSDTLVVRSVLPGGEQHDKFVGWMSDVATFLQSITDEQGRPLPFILRPWHEYNGSWFWWGKKLCSDAEFLGLWNMFQDYINEQLPAGNVVWSCSPNLQGDWTLEDFQRRFPADERVDIVGEDCYQWGTEEDFMRQATADVRFLSDYARQHGMLFAITECGMQNSPTPDWWSRVFKPVLQQSEACYFLPWRNWHADHFGASKDASTADDFKAFAAEPTTLFLKQINR